jgi:hypothetical protein
VLAQQIFKADSKQRVTICFLKFKEGYVFPLKYMSAALIKANMKHFSHSLLLLNLNVSLKTWQSLLWAMARGLFRLPNSIG